MGHSSSFLEKFIPAQKKGNKSDTVTRVKYHMESYAKSQFKLISDRLLDVNHWYDYAGVATARFQIYDEQGNEVRRVLKKGDYFQIDIPGPGTVSGEGNDWVQVKKLGQESTGEEDIVYFTVRSSPHPLSLNEKADHFFDKGSTSTFIVYRNNLEVMAGVFGRNERRNTEANNLVDRIRNSVIALGAIIGFSKTQWKALTYGLIHHHTKINV